jgi:MoxR-like ATPase
VSVPLPLDFRIIGTLNSFDRHFLNQISEAMKRRFTFIDVLPPARDQYAQEQAVAVKRALERLARNDAFDIMPDANGVVWEDVLRVVRGADGALQIDYLVDADGPDAPETLDSLWRIFAAIRVYRQLGTAQLESVCSAFFSGRMIGMAWADALDSALADVLADQLQVLARDEVRVLLACLEHAADAERFARAVREVLRNLPPARQMAHLAQLRAADPAPDGDLIDELDASKLSAAQLQRVFVISTPLVIDANGLFARRLRSFVHERGL